MQTNLENLKSYNKNQKGWPQGKAEHPKKQW